ncbi:AraC family transcriptional regulator [Amycolatopsis sp. AA4]|uniref:helix-turn-helix domain-containing protein n=1 Tax=Actinomycetes TaxID=1760 RepID=UPI0001B53A75|nr:MULTISPECIES: AraC family transcriptional regulator [Actinomycetes]ATY11975.1 AraC family transcriptional regulator [Amycolatopsis sp. AA4]
MVFDSTRLNLQPYAGFEMGRYVRRTYCSWEDAGWESLLVQRFEHVPVAEEMALPAAADLHLVLPVGRSAVMETCRGGRWGRTSWTPGRVELLPPDQPAVRRYRAMGALASVQVHIPRATVDSTAAQLGGAAVDFDALAASLTAGDPLVEEIIRAVGGAGAADDLYAESAAAFLTMQLLTRHTRRSPEAVPTPENARVRAVVAAMRERLAEPITLADLAGAVHLSVYHLVRVFKEATGETPYRYLTGLRIDEAKRLLRDTDLTVSQIAGRCGFASPAALSTAFLRHTGTRPSAYRGS